jgi:hypothetical protein
VFVEVVFVEAVFVELPEPGSDEGPDELADSAGDAQANPAGVAIAVPTPSAMAKAPNRPTYLLQPIALTAIAVTPFAEIHRTPGGITQVTAIC